MDMQRYNIAFLLGYPEISGGTNVIMEHAVGLSKRGHHVTIVTELPFEKNRLAWHPEAMQLECLSHEQIRDRVFDISIATWWRSVYDLPYVKAKRYAYFCQSIESRFFNEKDPDMKALAEFTYRLPLHIVTEATWIADYLRNHYGANPTLVHNGIKKEIFSRDGKTVDATRPNGLRFLVEGPLGVPFKKVEETVRLCQQAGVQDIWLLTSTETEQYPGVSRLFSKVPMKDVSAIYRSCDVLVKLSTVEGMFGPPLEMMHCGGIAITSNVTGHDEYMRHGENGLVVPIGDELQVIREIRRLLNHPEEVERLKSNAAQTAMEWPSWPIAVEGFEAFVHSVMCAEFDQQKQEAVVMDVLKAALRLAGPLHASTKRTYSKQDILYLVKQGAKRFVNNKFPRLAQRLRQKRNEPVIRQAPILPAIGEPVHLDAKSHVQVCFIGDKRLHAGFASEGTETMSASFWHAEDRLDANFAQQIAELHPDYLVILNMDLLGDATVDKLPGQRIYVSAQAFSDALVDRLRPYFATGHKRASDAHLYHVDSKTAVQLIERGIDVSGSFPMPVNERLFYQRTDGQAWRERGIPLLILGPVTKENRECFTRAVAVSDYLHLEEIPNGKQTAALLSQVQTVLYLSKPDEDLLRGSYLIRDMLAGCLTVSPRMEPDYTMMPGEHYLFYDTASDLESLILELRMFPDRYEHVRLVGIEKAMEFISGHVYDQLLRKD